MLSLFLNSVSEACCFGAKNTPSSLPPSPPTAAWLYIYANTHVGAWYFSAPMQVVSTTIGIFVIRLSLGKLLVDLLQVVKRTNTPPIPQQMASSTDHGFVGVMSSNPTIHNSKLLQTCPMSNLKNALPGIPKKRNRLDIGRSARISGRPTIPPFQGGRVIRLSLGKLSVNFLQVVKPTNTPLIP